MGGGGHSEFFEKNCVSVKHTQSFVSIKFLCFYSLLSKIYCLNMLLQEVHCGGGGSNQRKDNVQHGMTAL